MMARRAGAPINVAGVCLIPIERVKIEGRNHSYGYWINTTKEAEAVVICDLEGGRAVDIEGNELAIDALIKTVPGLASILESLCIIE